MRKALPERAEGSSVEDHGDFSVSYEPSETLQDIADAVKEARFLSSFLANLNAKFALEKPLPTTFKDCEGPDAENAFYSPATQSITICYQFINLITKGMIKAYQSEDGGVDEARVDSAIHNAMTFFFFHELGHAIVDIAGIQIPANAEDVADRFAVFALSDLVDNEDADQTLADAAVAFGRIVAKDDSLSDDSLGDEHPLGRQRALNLLCWVYGANSDDRDLGEAVVRGGLPRSRLALCPGEYETIRRAWNEQLDAHIDGDGPEGDSGQQSAR
ncbi:MAG: DUF4344 domain-containing metallopeptidase [Deltaproteobacteria bacterium]|nr:DUF4344 domain-containing metallopeptidase [Deltaproteobacteria bacterium]